MLPAPLPHRCDPVHLDGRHLIHLLVGILLLRPLARFLFRTVVERPQPLPAGPLLIVGNHRSFLDPPIAAMWWDRPLSYFARGSLWRLPIVGFVLRTCGSLPIDRHEPQPKIMRRTIDWLRAGRRIMLFPEGTRTRSGRLQPLRPGFALFARRAGVPVLPVYVHRSERVWPCGAWLPRPGNAKVRVVYGPLLRPPPGLAAGAADDWMLDAVTSFLQAQETRLLGPA